MDGSHVPGNFWELILLGPPTTIVQKCLILVVKHFSLQLPDLSGARGLCSVAIIAVTASKRTRVLILSLLIFLVLLRTVIQYPNGMLISFGPFDGTTHDSTAAQMVQLDELVERNYTFQGRDIVN